MHDTYHLSLAADTRDRICVLLLEVLLGGFLPFVVHSLGNRVACHMYASSDKKRYIHINISSAHPKSVLEITLHTTQLLLPKYQSYICILDN